MVRMRRQIFRTVRLLSLTSTLLLAVGSLAFGQNAFDTGTPAESRGGSGLISTFAQDKIETVNLANGNLSLHIPLASIGGRGGASYSIALAYNSKIWTGEQGFDDQNQINNSGTTYDDLVMRMPNVIALGSGWFILKGPTIKSKKIEIDWIPGSQQCPGHSGDRPAKVLTKVWLILPDGTEVELRDRASQGEPSPTHLTSLCVPDVSDRDRGRVWYSIDGSAITYVTDAANGVVLNQPAGYVFLSDGTRVSINNSGRCTKITDRNGNFVNINYQSGNRVTYTDQLGRQVRLEPTATGASVTILGYNGSFDRVFTIDTGLIGATDGAGIRTNLREDFRSVIFPIFNGDFVDITSHAMPQPHSDLFEASDFTYLMTPSLDQQSTVTRLNLLDGRRFQFRYNKFGELAEIVYPGGGISQIDYSAFGASLCDSGGFIRPQLNRRVSERRLLSNGTTVDGVWTYSRDTATVDGSTYPRVTIEAHQGSATGALLMREKHYFLNLDKQYLNCTLFRGNHGTGYDYWDNAKEFRVERTTGTGTELTKRNWEQRTPVLWGGGTAPEQPPNDPRVIQEDMILENGKMKRVVTEYDAGERIINAFNNVTRVLEYDFGTDGNPGPLRRETLRSYLKNLNSNCYVNLNGQDNDCLPDTIPTNLSRVIHNRRMLSAETIKDGNGNLEAYSDCEYDNYIDDPNHKPVVANPGMLQYDPSRFSPFTLQNQPRGNVTQVRRLIGGSPQIGTFTSSYTQYDEAGNAVKTIDPIGNPSTISYTDNFGDGSNPDAIGAGPNGATFALPTAATNALSQQVKTQYDYTRGLASGAKDPNLTVARTEFDVFDRPVRVTAGFGLMGAENSITEMSYPTPTANESKVSKQLDATRWLTSRTQFDGFGRPLLTSQTEDGRHFTDPLVSYTIHSKAIYDGLGRAVKSSNPYRSTGASSTDGWTRTAYDLAGRVIDVATFSGGSNTPPLDYPQINSSWTGSVVTAYNGEVTTVRDQTNKQRRSTVDGLGRLITVEEMNEYPLTTVYAATNYTYDARENLVTVTQAQGATTQTRRFAYDLLSRLIFAANPEQNTSADLLFTYNSQQWAVKYSYDVASNLTTKMDTRLSQIVDQFVTINYQYDPLNRITQRNYNDGTPLVTYVYDAATKGVGRLRSVTASGVSTYNYTIYDALGRPAAYDQVTEGQPYSMSSTYNKAGMVVDEVYPSGKVMHNEYDSAGRPAGVTKNGAAFYYAGAPAADSANRIQYSAHGATGVMKLGNGLWEHTNFNSRLQPTQIGLGANQTSIGVVGLDYTYATTGSDNNGNVRTQTITLPYAVPGTPYNTFAQSYTYDQVNRLATAREDLGPKWMWTQTYGYDRWGNRTSLANTGPKAGYLPTQTTPTVNPATNRLNAIRYDAAGNHTIAPDGATLEYDAENRMTRYAKSGVSYLCSYDGDGQRVKKLNADTTVFVCDVAGKMVAEYSLAAGSLPNVRVSYLTTDHLGSTRVVTDQNQNLVSRRDYMPFGEEIPELVSGRSAAIGYGVSDGVRQKFTQKERDNESGLDYFLARYYSSAQARFLSIDPGNAGASVRDPQSWNGYTYGRNNPLRYVDPDGLKVRVYDGNGNYVDLSDADANNSIFNRKYIKSIGFKVQGGKIYDNAGTLIGTYTRISFDDFTPQANAVVFGLAARAKAMNQAIAAFGVVSVVGGVGGGVVLSASGVMTGSGLTTLNIATTAFRPLASLSLNAVKEIIKGRATELLRQCFKPPYELPEGLTRGHLEAYREIATRAIAEGKDIIGEQAFRLRLIEKALEALK